MQDQSVERWLAAILAADVGGYDGMLVEHGAALCGCNSVVQQADGT
jgi:hypothetical protein